MPRLSRPLIALSVTRLFTATIASACVAALGAAELPESIQPTDWVVRPREGDFRRAPLHVDPVEAAVARGEWAPPTDEALETGPWRRDAEIRSGDLSGGYAYAEFDSPAAGVMLLEAPGAAAVCLNDEWLPGDPYGVGWFRPPAPVAKGANRLLVHLAAPGAKPRLVRPSAPIVLLAGRATLPDLVAGETPERLLGSIPLMNATEETIRGATLSVQWEGQEASRTPLRLINSLLVTPVTFEAPALEEALEPGSAQRLILTIHSGEEALASAELEVRVVESHAPRARTFRSAVDGSVQAYHVAPAKTPGSEHGLLVALHDAGQTAAECLAEYGRREGVDVLAPGGRGRWGFDWEGASRIDALEAIGDHLAREERSDRAIDPRRVAVVGRGMGGHGALVLGTTDPDRFSAIGVVDGWASFYSRGRAVPLNPEAGAVARQLAGPSTSRDPLRTFENLVGTGVSVLYTGRGRAGLSESGLLRTRLSGFHNDFWYREANEDDDPEALRRAQVDWLLERRAAEPGDRITLATPGVELLATRGWVTVLGCEKPDEVARVRLERDAASREISGVTENVRWLRLDLSDWSSAGPDMVRVRLNGGAPMQLKLGGRSGKVIALARSETGVWRRSPDVRSLTRRTGRVFKAPERSGGFGEAFTERPLLVYGTTGNKAERRWAAAKARYDAHQFLYRGAGRLEVVSDREFTAARSEGRRDDPLLSTERSIVLYGSRTTNAVWVLVRQEAFLRRGRTLNVEAGQVSLGQRPESGDGLAVLAVRPRPGSRRGYLGVIGGSDLVGMRMTTRLRYFWAGVAYPDFLLFGPRSLSPAPGDSPAADVRAAGWFDADWGSERGGVAWRDGAL